MSSHLTSEPCSRSVLICSNLVWRSINCGCGHMIQKRIFPNTCFRSSVHFHVTFENCFFLQNTQLFSDWYATRSMLLKLNVRPSWIWCLLIIFFLVFSVLLLAVHAHQHSRMLCTHSCVWAVTAHKATARSFGGVQLCTRETGALIYPFRAAALYPDALPCRSFIKAGRIYESAAFQALCLRLNGCFILLFQFDAKRRHSVTHPLLCLLSVGQSETVNRNPSAGRAAARQDAILWYALHLHHLSGLQRVYCWKSSWHEDSSAALFD